MPRPIVALLTDFGNEDSYVGSVKGAILSYIDDANIVDIAHDIPRHDVEAGAWCLASAFRAFPRGTVFLAVVDPGVGSERRGLALEAGGYRFVGPDNGLFTHILLENDGHDVRSITNRALMRPEVSATFHARDVFAPVAGRLAQGVPLYDVGPAVDDPVLLPVSIMRQNGPGEWEANVLHTDRFGNLTTSLYGRDLDAILEGVGQDPTEVVIVVAGTVIPLVRTYADVAEGEACALMGSSGRLEIAVNRGSAAEVLGAGKTTAVRVRTLGASYPAVSG